MILEDTARYASLVLAPAALAFDRGFFTLRAK